ncbi:MAG: F0F1 ATP synthase subunit A [Elusimicrobiota bacterium]
MNFDFEEIAAHHVLDHPIVRLFSVGGVNVMLTQHLLMMWIAGAVCLLFGALAGTQTTAGLVVRSGLEPMVLYIRDDMLRPFFGHDTEAYLPYFLTLFFFILILNLAGIVPYGATATGNISVTMGLAFCTYVLVHWAGIKKQGAGSYLKHIVPSGLPLFLIPLMFVLEVLGLIVKCAALCIRLFGNMIAGHLVALGFLSLIFIFAAMNPLAGLGVAPVAVGLAVFTYALEILVAVIQAYIFTVLTAVFVGMAVHPH